ncbi:MAG: beta-ketoacyl-ACP synthase [Sutterellaceae bacterium]|nr:beta-ketoacyl-ACP synthase [Sutterellaceae bacterium]MDD7442677.1 beta-ketoacyl-ACP synthase [Sutterellaceae bacterium]MDY2867632.1 beta-ketoacyl-ACP synthase [Mesosutterella sp.]
MIYVNAVSLNNALGATPEEILSSLASGTAPGMRRDPAWLLDGYSAFFGHMAPLAGSFPETLSPHRSRNNSALAAAWDSNPEFARLLSSENPERVAVVLGTSTSGIDEADRFVSGEKGSEGFRGEAQELGDPSVFLSAYTGASGPAYTISTACTSSAKAVISASKLIECGLADAAIAGGADTLARMPVNGFDALGALSRDLCRPFSGNRSGITIGEGAGLFWLSKEPAPVSLRGWGESSDGCSMTAPDPEGKGAEKAFREALAMACVKPDDISYINLHGTGTKLNDAMEARAVSRVFGDRVPCSSTKNLTGHTLGAAGITEAGLSVLLLSRPGAVLPPQFRDNDREDPSLPPIGLLAEPWKMDGSLVLTCNFAFGGSNAALLFGAE